MRLLIIAPLLLVWCACDPSADLGIEFVTDGTATSTPVQALRTMIGPGVWVGEYQSNVNPTRFAECAITVSFPPGGTGVVEISRSPNNDNYDQGGDHGTFRVRANETACRLEDGRTLRCNHRTVGSIRGEVEGSDMIGRWDDGRVFASLPKRPGCRAGVPR